MSAGITKFGACVVKSAVDQSTCMVKTFWESSPCIIALLRRFGCPFCRLETLELSRMKQTLQSKGVRLIAIGHDKDGLEDFKAGKFFDGELYMDETRDTYNSLELGRVGMVSGFMSLLSGPGRSLIHETKEKKVDGNLKGDGWQTGGLLVIDKGGDVLYSFKQAKITENPDYAKIRELFNVKEEDLAPLRVEQPKSECS
nr:hypothetical transcript [Hymenolepis microstoma]